MISELWNLSDLSYEHKSASLDTSESLFIDESFGSLDPQNLVIAIASLDTLQALGGKVGVIYHVPVLIGCIGAKVVVEKQGWGRSSVMIVGGYLVDWH